MHSNHAIGRRWVGQLLSIIILLCCSRSAHAQATVFAGAFAEVLHDGALSTTPKGVVAGAAGPLGAGVEARWAADSRYQWLSIGFLQIVPSTPRGKSFQPFGTVGPAWVFTGGERALGLGLGAGVVVFMTDHVGAVADFRYFKAPGTIDGVPLAARTISLGFAWRF